MKIFEYAQNPPVIFGAGAIGKLSEEIKKFDCKKILCVFDDGVKKAGIGRQVEKVLNDADIEYLVFDNVMADPPDTMLDEMGQAARDAEIDCVVGIGGGSSMDTAKAISILQKHDLPIRQYLNLDGPPLTLDGGVPVILIPTSSGTGSEVTRMCIVSNVEANAKLPIFTSGSLAIVDPELSKSAPAGVTANTGLDAFAHAAEAITANNGNPYSEVLAVEAIKRIAKYLPVAFVDGNNIEARTEMSLAANWAGIAFSLTDVHIGHASADSIAASYHTPHGLNCAWVTPAVLQLVATKVPEKVKLIGVALGVDIAEEDSPEEIGKKTADACRLLMKKVGVKSLEEYEFDRNVIITKGALYAANHPLRFNCPVAIDEAAASFILSSAYDDYK